MVTSDSRGTCAANPLKRRLLVLMPQSIGARSRRGLQDVFTLRDPGLLAPLGKGIPELGYPPVAISLALPDYDLITVEVDIAHP